jgi:hypothetical protein
MIHETALTQYLCGCPMLMVAGVTTKFRSRYLDRQRDTSLKRHLTDVRRRRSLGSVSCEWRRRQASGDSMLDQQSEVSIGEIWPNRARPASDEATERAALAALDTAVRWARAGDYEHARQLCAAVTLDVQPLIAARVTLLHAILQALLVAHGFRLLSRVMRALSGRNIEVVLLTEDAVPVGLPRVLEDTRRTVCAVDSRWLTRLSVDDIFLRRLSEMVCAQKPTDPCRVKPPMSIRALVPA